MGLFEEIRILSARVKPRLPNIKGEEATKHALVLPFLTLLGFDIHDPSEVQPEYVADFDRKRPRGQPEKVDYAIYVQGEPAIFIECKAVGVPLDGHDGQLRKYFSANLSVQLAILTDGLKYKFFTDLLNQNVMDPEPFLEFDILVVQEDEVSMIELFSKQRFNLSNVRTFAKKIQFTRKATPFVYALLDNPRAKLIPFIMHELANIVPGIGSDVRIYEPIIEQLLQRTVRGLMNKPQQTVQPETAASVATHTANLGTAHVEQGSKRTSPEQAAPNSATEPARMPATDKKAIAALLPPTATSVNAADAGLAMTDAEQEVFHAVSRILADSKIKTPRYTQVRTNCMAFNLGPARSWFLRMYSRGRRQCFTFQFTVAQVEPLAHGFEVGTCPDDFGKSRVFFGSVSEVERLRPLILQAYEDAVQRHESGSISDADKAE